MQKGRLVCVCVCEEKGREDQSQTSDGVIKDHLLTFPDTVQQSWMLDSLDWY